MIRLVKLYPKHLNLNGDIANVDVLARFFEHRGLPVEVIAVEKGAVLPSSFDFVLIGHGSIAAWNDLDSDWPRLQEQLALAKDSGVVIFAVASGFQKLASDSNDSVFNLVDEPTNHVSKFVVAALGDASALGYKNSSSSLPDLACDGSAYGTLLHGPVLSRSPQLLELVAEAIANHAGFNIGPVLDEKRNEADHLADLVKSVWDLEEELARE